MSNTRHVPPREPEAFDLDAFEAEANRQPFRFRLGGDEFEAAHAESLDWHDIRSLDASDLFLIALGDDRESFEAKRLSTGGYKALQRRYFEHSGLNLGEGARSASS